MALPGADSAAEIQFGYGKPEIPSQIRGHRNKVARQLQARVAPLADHGGIGLWIAWFERQFLAVDPAGGNFFHAHRGFDAHQRLPRGASQFIWIHPAPNLPGLENVLKKLAGTRSAQSAEGLNDLQSRKAWSFIVLHQIDQFRNTAGLAAHPDLVDGQRANHSVQRVVYGNQHAASP